MRNFNVVEDQMLNELALEYVRNGNEEAGEKFTELVWKKLERYANGKFSHLEKEDLFMEFMETAIRTTRKWAEEYADKGGNVMGLIFKACFQRNMDLGRREKATKRADKMVIGEEIVNRKVSLQSLIGEDKDATMIEKIAIDQKPVEDMVIDRITETAFGKVVNDIVKTTKGRNGVIIPIIVKSFTEDWEENELQEEIGAVIGSNNKATIRKAKQRAMEVLEKGLTERGWEL